MEENSTAVYGELWPFVRSTGKVFLSLFAAILIGVVVFKLFSFTRILYWILKELFLFWSVTWSKSSRALDKPLRLHLYFCETKYLDEVGVNELYNFLVEDINVKHGASANDIRQLLMQYTHILMCRDRLDGTLRGILLVGIQHKGDYTLLSTGLTVFKNYYRGSPYIQIIIAWLTLRELFRHPLTPVYVIGKLYSYKMYLKGVTMSEYYPVYNKETPEHFKKIFADYAAAILALKGEGAKYNPETFVIEQDGNQLSDHLTVLRERDLQNPHVKFFVERNPGWKKGHCLVVAFRVSWRDFFTTIRHTLSKFTQRKGRSKASTAQGGSDGSKQEGDGKAKRSARPKLLKRRTFQEMDANIYAVNNLEYDVMGGVTLSPSSKANFAFVTTDSDTDSESSNQHEMDVDIDGLSS